MGLFESIRLQTNTYIFYRCCFLWCEKLSGLNDSNEQNLHFSFLLVCICLMWPWPFPQLMTINLQKLQTYLLPCFVLILDSLKSELLHFHNLFSRHLKRRNCLFNLWMAWSILGVSTSLVSYYKKILSDVSMCLLEILLFSSKLSLSSKSDVSWKSSLSSKSNVSWKSSLSSKSDVSWKSSLSSNSGISICQSLFLWSDGIGLKQLSTASWSLWGHCWPLWCSTLKINILVIIYCMKITIKAAFCLNLILTALFHMIYVGDIWSDWGLDLQVF